ncbi:EF-hand domain-containing protein [Tsuneonella sp. HG249]
MRKITFSIGAAVLATTGIALAAPALAQQGDMTRAQVEAKAAERFARMDANNDGVLNAADREARRGQAFDKLDTNNDGSISEAEFNARQAARGAKRAERAAQHAGHQGMEQGKRNGTRGHRGGRMGMARMADTNGDNAISRAEFTAAALKRFSQADADSNGTVTVAERQTARQAMRAQWQAKRQATQPAN